MEGASEEEISIAVGSTLSPEQKQRLLEGIRSHINILDGLKSKSFLKRAFRWTVCSAGFFVLMSSKHVPLAGFGATFRSLTTYIELKTAAEETEIEDFDLD